MDLVPGPFGMPARLEVSDIEKIVIGLGNPGEAYAKTRHNIGWMVLDRLADRAGWSGRARNKDAAATVGGRYKGVDLLLVKPMTFMNDSGLAVRKVLARERAPLSEILVVTDDFADLGTIAEVDEDSDGFNDGDADTDGKLDVGETWLYTASHAVTQMRP